jgi:MFS family permease
MENDLSSSPPSVSVLETQSAVSWSAILAGSVAALALSTVLMALAAGFGLNLAGPWPGSMGAIDAFTPPLGAWMIVVQVLAAALGGYLAGRLRTRWTNVHGHEVHFRDTAHGLLVWATSTVAGVVLATAVLAPAARLARLDVATATAEATVASEADAALVRPDPAMLQIRLERREHLAAQISFFIAIGLVLAAFVASVAAAIGGLRREEMHLTFWKAETRGPTHQALDAHAPR